MDTVNEPTEAAKSTGPIARVDVACVRDRTLLAYGWALGLGSEIVDATVTVDSLELKLADAGILIARPDVSKQFAGTYIGTDDHHGFYLLADLPHRAQAGTLHLSLTGSDGQKNATDWPIVADSDAVAATVERLSTTFTTLSRKLRARDQRRLSRFCRSDFGLQEMLPPSVKVGIDTCCVIDGRFLFVYGWLQDPHELVTELKFCAGDTTHDLRKSAQIIPPPAEAGLQTTFDTISRRGFALGVPLTDNRPQYNEFGLQIDCGDGPVFLWNAAVLDPARARSQLSAFLEQIDASTAILIINSLRDKTAGIAIPESFGAWAARQYRLAVARLPTACHDNDRGIDLHIDSAVRVGTTGLFLNGWASFDPRTLPRIVCVCGTETFDITANWLHHRRPDVLKHLVKEGAPAATHSNGFACFVPLADGDAVYFLEIGVSGGEPWRVRLEVSQRPALAIDTVRTILMSFGAADWELGELFDHHVGPAVKAAWATREPMGTPFVQAFGDRPAAPEMSIIVPLFGRFDLAEYQLALFADDPAFQANELIYVVDDPAIFDDVRMLCPDLYATYRVPFVLAHPGSNLGFSGANNFAAGLARGKHLLLMNSDVFPKTPDFIPKLLDAYRAAPNTGILGAKLLFEDGSLQHAGIVFRQNPNWAGMWVNHHPMKGQSPDGLTGVIDVPAVTAACALIDTALYRELGGLSEDFILGDFEDSDLCLRAAKSGRQNRIAYDIELYHLERQSQNRIGENRWRSNLTLYNCWVHDRRWSDFIAEQST